MVVKTCKLLLILTRQRRPLGVRLPNTLKFKGLILPGDGVCTINHVYCPSVLEQRPTHPHLLTDTHKSLLKWTSATVND